MSTRSDAGSSGGATAGRRSALTCPAPFSLSFPLFFPGGAITLMRLLSRRRDADPPIGRQRERKLHHTAPTLRSSAISLSVNPASPRIASLSAPSAGAAAHGASSPAQTTDGVRRRMRPEG